MNNNMNKNIKRRVQATRELCVAAIIAALYVLLTYASAMFGLDKGIIQFRISEALCAFAIVTPAAVPGMTVGCLIANLLCGATLYDIIFGTLATLIGILGTRALRKLPYLAPLPYVLSNSIIMPLVLQYAYGVKESFYILLLTVGLGETVCAYAGGLLVYFSFLKTRANRYFN